MTTTLVAHPVADLFPMLADDELIELAADIAERGLLQPIVLDGEGRVLDGRNRLAACEIAGVEPIFATYEGDDPDGYALVVNIARRHLNKGQIAMIAARASYFMTQRAAARAVKVSHDRVHRARTVLDHAEPDLADSVVSGAMSLDIAYEKARKNKQAGEGREEKLARLRAEAPDLADSVVDEENPMTLDEAIAALDVREAEARRDIAAARRTAQTIVTQVRTLAVTILTGSRLGESDLITKEMVLDLRATVDLLEEEL